MLAFLAVAVFGIAVLRSKRLSLLAERGPPSCRCLTGSPRTCGTSTAPPTSCSAHGPLVVGTAISFVSWGLECLGVYLCAVGLGADLGFLTVVFVFAVSSLLGVLSMLPGGIGAVEAGLAVQFVTVAGLSAGLAGALTLIIRLATLWFATLVGIVGLLVVRRILGDAPLDTET